jgi:hypothetical protein
MHYETRYVGSDLKHLCTEAATRAAVEHAECVTADHFYSAIANGRPAALTTQAIGATHRPTVKLSDVQGCDTQVITTAALLIVKHTITMHCIINQMSWL